MDSWLLIGNFIVLQLTNHSFQLERYEYKVKQVNINSSQSDNNTEWMSHGRHSKRLFFLHCHCICAKRCCQIIRLPNRKCDSIKRGIDTLIRLRDNWTRNVTYKKRRASILMQSCPTDSIECPSDLSTSLALQLSLIEYSMWRGQAA